MNRIDNSGKGIAGLGRNEDSMLAHVAPGEMVVPPVISPATQRIIQQEMMSAGLDPNEYTVGEGMSINPITGMAEFGFLKKLGKSLKKVAKKVAPVIGPLANFIPGVGPLLAAAIQAGTTKLAGGSWKDALKAGVVSYGVGKIGQGIKGLGSTVDATTGVANAASKTPGFFGKIKGGIGSFFNPAEGTPGIFKGSIGPNIRRGIGGLFGGMGPSEGPMTGGEQELMFQDGDGNTYSASKVEEMLAAGTQPDNLFQVQSSGVQSSGVQSSGSPFNIGRAILGKGNTPGFIKGIEDSIKGPDGKIGGGDGSFMGVGSGGLNPGMMAMAALYGKAVKEDFKRKEGGMKDVRQSIRPDLMPQQTFQGFDLGVRKNAAMGGFQELDMRMGGPSIGPGTGTSDDIPAMLSDGEFVQTAKANNGLGGFKVTKTETGIEMIPNGKPSRKKGAKNMDTLMKMFENYNDIGRV